ncbi:MAG: MFS transporter, partial [Alphaproteobacteria bacterium]|nr:MFS transporter [Alphaproteobacteria bacterium]
MAPFLTDPVVRTRSIVLIASLLFILVGTGSIYFIVVALKEIAAEFSWPRTVPSTAYALQYLGTGIGGIFMGWYFDRRGMEIPAFVGGSMIGVGAILTSFVSSQWELFFIYGAMLGFFGRSALFGPLTTNITHWFEHKKSLAVGVVSSGQGLAGMLWPPVFHHLIAAVGWRQTALIYGVFTLVAMLLLALILRQKPPTPKPQSAVSQTFADAPRSSMAIQASLSTASVGCCVAMSLPLAHVVSHVSDLGFDPARGAEVLSLMLGCSVISSLFGVGFLGGRYGGLRALFIFSIVQAILLATLAFASSLPGIYLAA